MKTVFILSASILFPFSLLLAQFHDDNHAGVGLTTVVQTSSVQNYRNIEAHHRQPKVNPLNPDLIAYEQGGSIKIINKGRSRIPFYEIKCDDDHTVRDRQPQDMFTLDMEEDSVPAGNFDCAYFDWRPVKDSSGNYWFAYSSARDRSLNLGYIGTNNVVINNEIESFFCWDLDNNTGESITRNCEHFEIYRSTNRRSVNRPKWAPDGQSLIFNEGTGLYRTEKLSNIIQSKSAERVDVQLVTEYAFYPEWSPDGRYLAYEYSPSAGQQGGGDISIRILDMYENTRGNMQGRQLQHFLLNTQGLPSEQYKPRWSSSGNYLSYVIPGDRENEWNVKVDEVTYSNDGSIDYLESVTIGERRYLAGNVFRGVGMRSGYPVVELRRSDGTVGELLITIQNDQDQGNPIYAYPLNVRASTIKLGNTIQNNHIDVAFDGETTHISFVSQQDGSYRLQYITMNAAQIFPANNQPQTVVKSFPQDLSPRKAMIRSAMVPGYGQFYKGDTQKGLMMLGGAIIAATGLGLMLSKNNSDVNRFNSKADEFNNDFSDLLNGNLEGPLPLSELNEKYDGLTPRLDELKSLESKISRNNMLIVASATVLAGVYALSIYDSRKGFPIVDFGEQGKRQITVAPQIIPDHEYREFAGALRFNFSF